jgi:hypothetical protein
VHTLQQHLHQGPVMAEGRGLQAEQALPFADTR